MSYLNDYRNTKPANPSAAVLKVDEFRDAMNMNREDVEKVVSSNYQAVAYLYTSRNKPCVIAYVGRKKKPTIHFYFNSEADREARVEKFFETEAKIAEDKKSRKKTSERSLEVGDVLRSSWGYEQTNIDYYLVTELVGKASVKIVEIGSKREYDDMDRGTCVPDPSNIIGEPLTKRANGDGVRIASFAFAFKIGYKEVDGERVYESSYWSSYH